MLINKAENLSRLGSSRGLTLLELLIVLVIIGLLAACSSGINVNISNDSGRDLKK